MATFTRNMEAARYSLEKEFGDIYDNECFRAVLTRLKKYWNASNKDSLLNELYNMMDAVGIRYERGREFGYYVDVIRSARLPDADDIPGHLLASLYRKWKSSYPSQIDYMKRNVDRLEKEADGWSALPLRLRILRQFIKYGHCLSYTQKFEVNDEKAGKSTLKKKTVNIYGGALFIRQYAKAHGYSGTIPTKQSDWSALADCVDDDIFAALDTAEPPELKMGGKYALLKLADDLAHGHFYGQGVTKKGLYYFALVYDMTWFSGSGADGSIRNEEKDIEKNLFEDVYNLNMFSYTSEASAGQKHAYLDRDPAGTGINFKNFAEMVFLYYIGQENMEPWDKVQRAHEMIERLQSMEPEGISTEASPTQNRSRNFKDRFLGISDSNPLAEDWTHRPEEEFEAFLLANYDCCTRVEYKNGGKCSVSRVSEMTLEAENNTACTLFMDLMSTLPDGQFRGDLRVTKPRCVNWLTEAMRIGEEEQHGILTANPDIDAADFSDFCQMMERFCQSIVASFFGKEVTAANITRTTLTAACCTVFCRQNEDKAGKQWSSFKALFKNLRRFIDLQLIDTGYLPFSGRSLPDLLMTYAVYRYLYLNSRGDIFIPGYGTF